jgi:hypothetical protein
MSLASTVEKIDDGAFWGCEALGALKLPASLTVVGANAFRGMKSLTSVVIPATVTDIGIHAFYGCTSLTVYTDAAKQSEGWNMWNTSFRPVIYGCTLSEEGFVSGVTVSEGSVVNASAFGGVCAPSLAGFEFKGWALSEDGEAQYSASEIIPVPAGTTLFAVWQEPTSE